MTLKFTHLKLLVQLNNSPLIVESLDGRRILALQELEKQGLVSLESSRAFISTKGLEAITHIIIQFNEFVQS